MGTRSMDIEALAEKPPKGPIPLSEFYLCCSLGFLTAVLGHHRLWSISYMSTSFRPLEALIGHLQSAGGFVSKLSTHARYTYPMLGSLVLQKNPPVSWKRDLQPRFFLPGDAWLVNIYEYRVGREFFKSHHISCA